MIYPHLLIGLSIIYRSSFGATTHSVVFTSSNYIGIATSPDKQEYDWYGANEYCNTEYGTTLATVLNSFDQQEIVTKLNAKPFSGNHVWIGWKADNGGRNMPEWYINDCYKPCDGYDWPCSAHDEIYANWHTIESQYWSKSNFLAHSDTKPRCGVVDVKNNVGNGGVTGTWKDKECTFQHDMICNNPNGKYGKGLACGDCDEVVPNVELYPNAINGKGTETAYNMWSYSIYSGLIATTLILNVLVYFLMYCMCIKPKIKGSVIIDGSYKYDVVHKDEAI